MAKPKKQPPPLPMPVDIVAASKHLLFTTGAVERAIWTISCRFWLSGADQEAFNETAAREVAKQDGGTWTRVQKPLMAAMADIIPALAHARAVAEKKRLNLFQQRSNAGLTARANDRRKNFLAITIKDFDKNNNNQSNKSIAPAPVRTPQTAREYKNNNATTNPKTLAKITKQTQQNQQDITQNKTITRFVDE